MFRLMKWIERAALKNTTPLPFFSPVLDLELDQTAVISRVHLADITERKNKIKNH